MNEQDNLILDDSRVGSELTPKIIQDLKTTSGWLRYLGILGFIVSALAITGIFVTLFSLMGTRGSGHYYPGQFFIGMFVMVLFLGMVIYLSVLLYQYGNGIRSFIDKGKNYDLEEAFEKQKIYWTVSGVLATLVIGFYVLMFLVGVAGAI